MVYAPHPIATRTPEVPCCAASPSPRTPVAQTSEQKRKAAGKGLRRRANRNRIVHQPRMSGHPNARIGTQRDEVSQTIRSVHVLANVVERWVYLRWRGPALAKRSWEIVPNAPRRILPDFPAGNDNVSSAQNVNRQGKSSKVINLFEQETAQWTWPPVRQEDSSPRV